MLKKCLNFEITLLMKGSKSVNKFCLKNARKMACPGKAAHRGCVREAKGNNLVWLLCLV